MLVAMTEERRVEAFDVEKGPEFRCPNCEQVVVLKKGRIKIAHFAHKPPTACTWASGETQAHMAAKRFLREGFSTRGLTAQLEVPVLSSGGDRRADVLVTASDGVRRVAIEVQHQPIDYDKIYRRTAAYIAAGVPVIWVAILNDTVWSDAEQSGRDWIISRFAPRPWQKWVHAYGLGELWFIDVSSGKLWKGKFSASIIHVEHTSWYDSYGNEESAGGYDRYSKRWKTLTLSGPYDPATVLMNSHYKPAWSGRDFSLPDGQRAFFIAP